MKLEKAVSGIWAFALSGILSLSAVMCMVTAFNMGVRIPAIVLCCLIAAAVCSVCFTLPLKLAPPALGALALGYLWRSGSLELSLEALLNRLTRQYDKAYSWGIIRWGFRTADEMEPTMAVMLCVLGVMIVMAVSWSVCKGKSALPGIGLSALCVATCFVVTDTVPDTVWLYFLLLGAVSLLLTGKVRRQDPVQGNRLSLLLVPAAALALLVLLVAVPKQSYHGQADAQRLVDLVLNFDPLQLLRGEHTNGILSDADSVDLTTVGYRVESNVEVMSVTADFDGTLYLRSRAMNTYNGKFWYDSKPGNGPDWSMLGWPEMVLEAGQVTISTRYAHRMLYTPYYLSVSQMRDATAGILNKTELTEYTFDCREVIEFYTPAQIYLSPNTAPREWTWEMLAQFITLPDHVKKWAQPLAQEITGDVVSPYHRANAIAEYVRASATYDTDTPRMPTSQRDFAQWFLEDSDTGYCVHFASAAAVLLQASGIPARYVTGYTVTTQAGQAVPVQAKQAHAWVEYWLPGFGWTILEATPADLRQQDQTEPSAATTPAVTGPAMTQPDAEDTPGQSQSRDNSILLTALLWVAVSFGTVGLALAQRKTRLWLHARQYSRETVNGQALLRWQEVTRLARLTGQTPDVALFDLAQKAKYSQYAITEEELARFDDYAAAAIALLKKRSVFHRFYYCMILAVY